MSFPGSSRQWLKFDLNHRPSLEKGLSERQVFWRLNDDPKWLWFCESTIDAKHQLKYCGPSFDCDAHLRAIFKATSEFDFMSCLCWFVLYLCAAHFCCTIVFKCVGLCHCTLKFHSGDLVVWGLTRWLRSIGQEANCAEGARACIFLYEVYEVNGDCWLFGDCGADVEPSFARWPILWPPPLWPSYCGVGVRIVVHGTLGSLSYHHHRTSLLSHNCPRWLCHVPYTLLSHLWSARLNRCLIRWLWIFDGK